MCYAISLVIAVIGGFLIWCLCAIAARMDDLQGIR